MPPPPPPPPLSKLHSRISKSLFPFSLRNFIPLAMAASSTIAFLLLFLSSSSISSAAHAASRLHRHNQQPRPTHSPPVPSTTPYSSTSPAEPSSPIINQACAATRFPSTCHQSLITQKLPNPDSPSPAEIIKAAIDSASSSLTTAQQISKSILANAAGEPNRTAATQNCIELLGYSAYRLGQSSLIKNADAIRSGGVRDVRAWLSAGLTYQYDCWSAYKYANTTDQVASAMEFINGTLLQQTSNALAMAFALDRFGDDTGLWTPPQTERDGLTGYLALPLSSSTSSNYGSDSGTGYKDLDSLGPEDVVVCKEGKSNGCFGSSIQEAVDSAPDHGLDRFVIRIKEGVYEEIVRVPASKSNVVFWGDGIGKTVITGSQHVGPIGMTTYQSATVGVNGDGFVAKDITFQNTAGPDAHQAVAFRSDSDLSLLDNCEFLGHQDTLYAHTLRQLYRSCRIQGTVDFIFGNSATVFQNCTVLTVPRQLNPEKGETNTFTAQGRTDPSQSTGFVFDKCVVNATDDYMALYNEKPSIHRSYLGRPWKEFSRTVFLQCYLGVIVRQEGWSPWQGDFALPTLYYGEYQNYGPGSGTSARVAWSSQIPSGNIGMYSVENFIQGNDYS